MRLNKTLLVLLAALSSACTPSPDPLRDIKGFSKKLADDSLPMGLVFKSLEKTMMQPLSYRVVFSTTSPYFMTTPKAGEDKAATVLNGGITLVWQAKFCAPELRKLMTANSIALVSGDLQDSTGETQRIAVCAPG